MKKVLYQIGNRRAVLMNERVARFLASRGRGIYYTADVPESQVVTTAIVAENETEPEVVVPVVETVAAEVEQPTEDSVEVTPTRRRGRRRSAESKAE